MAKITVPVKQASTKRKSSHETRNTIHRLIDDMQARIVVANL